VGDGGLVVGRGFDLRKGEVGGFWGAGRYIGLGDLGVR